MYTEVEEDIHLSQENLSKYVGLVNWICHEYQHPALSNEAFRRLILAGMRYTEDQHYLPLGVLWHNQLLGLATSIQTHRVSSLTILIVLLMINITVNLTYHNVLWTIFLMDK